MKKYHRRYIKNKIVFILLFFIPLMVFAEDYKRNINFGLDMKSLVKGDYADSKVALSLWMKELGEKENMSVNVIYYNNQSELLNDYINKKTDIIVKDVVSYLNNYEKVDASSEFLWSLADQINMKFSQYYLISNKKSKIKKISDIKGKKLSIKENDSLAKVWLDTLSYKNMQKPYKKIIKKQKCTIKQSRALLDIIFKESDFAVITKNTWDIMVELNPSIKQHVGIILKSKPIFLPIIGASQKYLKHKFVSKFTNTIQRVKETIRGKQIRSLIKFDRAFIIKDDDLKPLFIFYNEYKILKSSYK